MSDRDFSSGALHSDGNFDRSGFALRFQLAFRPQPIRKVVAGIASPIQVEFISAVLDLFWIRIMYAVGTLRRVFFLMFHIFSF